MWIKMLTERPYLAIISLNWLVQTKRSDRDECPQIVMYANCYVFVYPLESSSPTTCKTMLKVQVENVNNSEDRTRGIGSFTLQAMKFGLVMLFTREN